MLKIWGRLSSINVQKVVICADLLGLAYERVDAGMKFGIVDTPAYREMNPNGLIPTIQDGEFVLYESNPIVRYLARTYGLGGLWPEDSRRVADADRWMEWQSTNLTPAMGDAFVQLVRTPAAQRDPSLVDASIAKTESRMAILDAHLATQSFVAGSALTMGDIPAACAVHRWFALPAKVTPRPHAARWLAGLCERPAFRNALTLPIT